MPEREDGDVGAVLEEGVRDRLSPAVAAAAAAAGGRVGVELVVGGRRVVLDHAVQMQLGEVEEVEVAVCEN